MPAFLLADSALTDAWLCFVDLEDDLLTAEMVLTAWLRGTINDLCDAWEIEQFEEAEGDARGTALVERLYHLTGSMRDRVWEALHIDVKRALVVVRSGYEYSMDIISSGFIIDKDKSTKDNLTMHRALINAAKGPDTLLAMQFEGEVLSPVDDEEQGAVLLELHPQDGDSTGVEGGGAEGDDGEDAGGNGGGGEEV